MKKIYLLVSLFFISVFTTAQTVTWNFGTAAANPAPSSGIPVTNLTISDITQGNNNGTTTLLTTTSASNTYPGFSGQFNAGAAARVGVLNTAASGSAYFEFTLTPSAGATVSMTAINFGSRSTGTGPQAYSVRTSLDGYASDAATGVLLANSAWAFFNNTTSITSGTGTPITIRIYGHNGAGSPGANTANWRIDDLSITVNVSGGAPNISVSAVTSATEPSSNGSFNLTFSTATVAASTTFDYALTGTAIFNTDYSVTLSGSATPSPLVAASGTITVPVSTTSITVTITPIDDPTNEGNETIILTLSNPGGGYTLGTASANITLADDDIPSTPLSTIQGSGTTASAGSFTVTAIVTGIYSTLSPAGFYIQEEDADADADPNTSEGIFVVSATPVAVGDLVRVTGTVQENGSTPSFNQAVFATATVTILSNANPLPAFTDITLPVTAIGDYEKYEGMRVRFPGTLTVTDNDALGSFGELKLSAGGLVYQPTQIIDPNDAVASGTTSTGASNVAAITALTASNNLRTILLDDGRGTIPTLPYVNGDNTVRVGSTIDNITGILGFAFSQYRLQPIAAAIPTFTHAARPALPGYGTSPNLKVASFNVLNYFDGTASNGPTTPIPAGFPTPRGAHSAAEFTRQRDKIIESLKQIDADVVGLIEIANNGSNNPSAIQNLVDGLNTAIGSATYAFINDGAVSQTNNTDQIRCAIIYKPAVVTPVGVAMLGNNAAIFDRPPLAQTFNLIATNKTFNFVVNHFKSKGGCPGSGVDADQLDGQSCWNNRRKLQADALLDFFNTPTTGVIAASGTNRIITVGDYNAYYEEDPMDILRAGGYTVTSSGTSYSYLFGGQLGSLDHAVVSSSLAGSVTGIAKWNTNSVEPSYLDYNDAISTNGGDPVNPWAATYTPSQWRASDHDAILMGLFLDAVLPVTITNFSAVKENATSKLSWTTSQEVNSREFVVERSVNGGNSWEVIAVVPASGNSNSSVNYNITDASPVKGANLYRLKSVDLDSKFEYSAIRRVNFDNKYTFSLYPNPATDVIRIAVDNSAGLNAQVQVINTQSQVLISRQINSSTQPATINVATLAAGVYFLRIITTDGTVTIQKFSKQ
ncbi:hypothetical protein CAP36_05445 [Chitinophagaceae bacterium IBVUCB2]|nr:hypothetical protein CAP36_05445 [Chitinophagaceae bacterium IBVUCB2]